MAVLCHCHHSKLRTEGCIRINWPSCWRAVTTMAWIMGHVPALPWIELPQLEESTRIKKQQFKYLRSKEDTISSSFFLRAYATGQRIPWLIHLFLSFPIGCFLWTIICCLLEQPAIVPEIQRSRFNLKIHLSFIRFVFLIARFLTPLLIFSVWVAADTKISFNVKLRVERI